MDATLRERQTAYIERSLLQLIATGQVFQVAALKPFAQRVFTGDVDGIRAAAGWAAARSGQCAGVYWTLNPLKHSQGSGKSGAVVVEDFAERWWLFIDVERPAGAIEENASVAEMDAAGSVVKSIRETLEARGFGGLVVAESGNGLHLYVPVVLPVGNTSRESHKLFLKCLGERFNTAGAVVDQQTSPIDRKGKVPGTLVRKFPETPGRPHRYAKLVALPDNHPRQFAESNTRHFEKLLSDWGRGGRRSDLGLPNDREGILRRAMAYLEKMEPAVSGQKGHDCCYHVACVLRKDFDLTDAEALEVIRPWNARCQPPWSDAELIHKIRDAGNAAGPNGKLKDAQRSSTSKNGTHHPPAAKALPDGPIIIRADAITARRVEWLIPKRVPLGKLTTFAGQGGLGKTFVMLDIAARLSRGAEWPGGGGECAETSSTLFISGEDDEDDTLVPRLIGLGADLSRIGFLRSEVADQFTLADLETLDRAIGELKGVKYVAIDPPTAYLGGVNDHRNSELRGLLSPLKNWAKRHRVAVVFNTHFSKSSGIKVEAAQRVIGSVAWSNAVRGTWIFCPDPDDDARRLFVPAKMNLSEKPKALAYRIVSTPGDGVTLEWCGEVDVKADDLVNSMNKPRRVVATEWLVERFREKRSWPSNELFAAGKQEGISRNAIYEAKASLCLPPARKEIQANGDTVWVWEVSQDWERLGVKTEQAF